MTLSPSFVWWICCHCLYGIRAKWSKRHSDISIITKWIYRMHQTGRAPSVCWQFMQYLDKLNQWIDTSTLFDDGTWVTDHHWTENFQHFICNCMATGRTISVNTKPLAYAIRYVKGKYALEINCCSMLILITRIIGSVTKVDQTKVDTYNSCSIIRAGVIHFKEEFRFGMPLFWI